MSSPQTEPPLAQSLSTCDARGGLDLCSAAQLSEALNACGYWDDPVSLNSAKVGLESAVVALALTLAAFHLWQLFHGFREWTLFYYSLVVAAQYLISLTATGAVPVALYVPCTAPLNWLRYAAWLLIVPAMVMALCRVTGLSSVYPRLQDPLLLLSVLMVVLGVSTAAAADITTKAVLFALAGVAGLAAFVYAAIQFIELYYTLNIVVCRRGIYPLAALWGIVWVGYPVLFIAGPEGFGSLSAPGSAIAYAFIDLAKLSWGLCAWNLHQNCRSYALKYGTTSKKVALPFGLGTVAVRTFFNENDLEETETGSQTAGAHYLEDEAEALQAA
nr:protein 69 [synthetic construct]